MWGCAIWLFLAVAMLLAVSACSGRSPQSLIPEDSMGVVTATVDPGATAVPTRPIPRFVSEACNRAFEEAAAKKDLWHTVEALFPALDACDSLTEWVGATYQNRGAIVNDVDPVLFAKVACKSYEGASTAPVCKDLGY